MAWTTAQEDLVARLIGPELYSRLDKNQSNTIARLFDPTTPALAKALLSQKLNALKTFDQSEVAALPARTTAAQNALNAEIALIDSVLATLV